MTDTQNKARGLSEAARQNIRSRLETCKLLMLICSDGNSDPSRVIDTLMAEIVIGAASIPSASPSPPSPEELEVLADLRAWCTHSPETESLVGPSPVRKRALQLVEMFERRFGGAQPVEPSAPVPDTEYRFTGSQLADYVEKCREAWAASTHPIAPVSESELAKIENDFRIELFKYWTFDDHQQHTHSWHTRCDFGWKVLPRLIHELASRFGSRLAPQLTPLQRKELTNAVGTLEAHGQGDSARLIRERMLGDVK